MGLNTLIMQTQELLNLEPSSLDLETRQLELEETADGYEREQREGKRLEDVFKRTTDDPMVQRILTGVIDKMISYFDIELAKTVRGKGAKYRNILRALDVEVLVGTILTHSLDRVIQEDSINSSIQRLGSAIGKGIVTEVKSAQAYDLNPMYMDKVDSGLRRRRASNKKFIKSVYDAAFDAITLGSLEYDLNEADYIHIGKFGIEAMLDAGLIVTDNIYNRGRSWNTYVLAEDVREYILAFQPEIHKKALSSMFRYMICKPDRWEGMSGGGFKSPRRKMYNKLLSLKGLTRELYQKYAEEFTPEKMPKVFNFVNYIQEIPYTLNRDVLDLLHKVYESGGGILGVPDSGDPVEPVFPFDVSWDKEEASEEELTQFNSWKYSKRLWHEEILERRQKRRELTAFFQAVRGGVDKLYFSVFLDYRGRMYYNANPNPQGSDIARACLHFYEKKPLGERGLYWLKVHLANSLGVDGDRFNTRVAYVDSIWHVIENALGDPIRHSEAFGDEAPMSAYVTALEIKRAIDSGSPEHFLSGIPVHMDATVSGTQHFSAMLRDEVGAEFTNLIDLGLPKKADLYTQVANTTLNTMNAETDVERMDYAVKWVVQGMPRDLVKRPIMTYTYGVTKKTVHDHIAGWLGTETRKHIKSKDIYYATECMFGAIAETIPATVQGMDFLQEVAKDVGAEPMQWVTPSGFWIYFNILKVESKRIAIRSAGVDLVWLRLPSTETHKAKMVSGVAPNYVHGNDAAHLCLVGNGMKEAGLSMVAIHDSIATHPSDVDLMHKIIRKSFVDMYNQDVLASFRDQVGSKVDLPMYGEFDLNHVLESEFFFC